MLLWTFPPNGEKRPVAIQNHSGDSSQVLTIAWKQGGFLGTSVPQDQRFGSGLSVNEQTPPPQPTKLVNRNETLFYF